MFGNNNIFNSNYQAQLSQLQQEYQRKLGEIQQNMRNEAQAFLQPPAATPAPTAPAAPEGAVPVNMQTLALVGEVKAMVESLATEFNELKAQLYGAPDKPAAVEPAKTEPVSNPKNGKSNETPKT